MSHVNNAIFSKRELAHLLQHATENNFGKQKNIAFNEKKMSIHNEYITLFLKSSVLAPNHITVKCLHFALISMETEIH